jgi:hypothetical protein
MDVNFEGDFPQDGFHYMFFRRDMLMTDTDVRFAAFSRAWEAYARRLSLGLGPFIVVQDPWKRSGEIPVSTEVAEKALVLGGFP